MSSFQYNILFSTGNFHNQFVQCIHFDKERLLFQKSPKRRQKSFTKRAVKHSLFYVTLKSFFKYYTVASRPILSLIFRYDCNIRNWTKLVTDVTDHKKNVFVRLFRSPHHSISVVVWNMSWKRTLVFSCTVLSVFAQAQRQDLSPADTKEYVSLSERSKDFYVLSQDDFEAIIDFTRPQSLQNLTLLLNVSYSVDVPGIVALKSPPMDQKTILDGSSFALPIHAEAPGIVIVQIGVSTYNSSIPLK